MEGIVDHACMHGLVWTGLEKGDDRCMSVMDGNLTGVWRGG